MSQEDGLQNTVQRLATGVSGLDRILEGGVLEGGVYILVGAPGAGKTILANQMAFHQVQQGRKVAYITLLAESHSRMLTHLKGLSYFDPSVLSERLLYMSAFRTLEETGLSGLLELLRREIRTHKVTLLVIDGLVQAQESASTARDFKKFIHELQSFAHLTRCTTLLLTSAVGEVVAAEHTMVDGVIELNDEAFELRKTRELEVRKFRGSSFLRGRHSFRITDEGLVVHPRIETTVGHAPQQPPEGDPRCPFGVEGLDAMLAGGVPMFTSTMLSGTVGSGKTVLGLQFLAEGARRREKGLYFNFYESPPMLIRKAARLGLDLQSAVDEGWVHFQWQPPLELQADVMAELLFSRVRELGIQRLVFDGLEALMNSFVHPPRVTHFIAALTQELRVLGVTALFTHEAPNLVGPEVPVPLGPGVSASAENLLFVRQVELAGQLRRLICIWKARDTEFDSTLREFVISHAGVKVLAPMPGAGQLTGEARSALSLAGRGE